MLQIIVFSFYFVSENYFEPTERNWGKKQCECELNQLIKLFGININLYKVASLVGEIKFSLICNHGAITSEKCIFSRN